MLEDAELLKDVELLTKAEPPTDAELDCVEEDCAEIYVVEEPDNCIGPG